jgi:general secretion pathway protein D
MASPGSSADASAAIAPTFPGYSYVFSQGTNIKIVLDALASITHVDVVSSPQLLVLNNQEATLQVGDQVPIVAQQAVSTLTTGAPLVNSVQYQSTGVILRVTPRVNQGGMVTMDISQEVSDVAATTTSSIDSPTIKQRKIESTVAVRDNETVALGGLMMEGTTRGRSGIPVLQDIPVLGWLFGTTSTNTTKTELMVLITPHVIDSMQKARSVTEELQRKLPALQILFDRTR